MTGSEQLSEEERALFHHAVRDVMPLPRQPLQAVHPALPPHAQARPAACRPLPGITLPLPADLSAAGENAASFRAPGLTHGMYARLCRGKLVIQASLDLHGLTVRRASGVLQDYLESCRMRQLNCVTIIHGKGQRSRDQQGVLRELVRFSLRGHAWVLAYCPARGPTAQGETWVLLRRP